MSDDATGKNLRAPAAEIAKKQRWGEAGPGRPVGSKQKLSELFLSKLVKDFDKNGEKAIAAARQESPVQYLNVIAKVLPKDVNVNVAEVESMAEEEIHAELARLDAEIGDVADAVSTVIRDRADKASRPKAKAKARTAKTPAGQKPH